MRIVVVFDVSDDRKRAALSKLLLDHGSRVQKSVFEIADLSHADYLRLRSDAEGIVDRETDSLRYYRLCSACTKRIEHAGSGVGLLEIAELFEIID